MSASELRVATVLEVTQGVNPTTAMVEELFSNFAPSGGVQRGPEAGVRASRVKKHEATTHNTTLSAGAPLYYGMHDLYRRSAFGAAKTAAATTGLVSTLSITAGSSTLTNTAGWSGFAVGDICMIRGCVTNPGFWVFRVTAISGNDLTYATTATQSDGSALTDESPASAEVYHDGQQVVAAAEHKTLFAAMWDKSGTKFGDTFAGVAVNSWQMQVQGTGAVTQTFNALVQKLPTGIVQPSNTVTALVDNGNHFRAGSGNIYDSTYPERGFGPQWGGTALASDFCHKTLSLQVQNSAAADACVHTFGPASTFREGEIAVSIGLTFNRQTTSGAALILDARAPATDKSFGFGMVDDQGNRLYFYQAHARPSDGNPTGVSDSGQQTATVNLMGDPDSTHGPLRVAYFTVRS